MIDFLKMMFGGFTFNDGFTGFFMSFVFTLVSGFILLLIGAGIVWIADNVGMDQI